MTEQIKSKLEQLHELNTTFNVFEIQKKELIDSILTPEIRAQLAEIEAEFADKTATITEKKTALESEVRRLVLENGATVKSEHMQAVFTNGRVSWDTKQLDGLMIAIPQLAQARKQGEPYVTIRG